MKTKYDLKRLWLTRGVFALFFTMLLLVSGLVSAQTYALRIYGPGSVTVSGGAYGPVTHVGPGIFGVNTGQAPGTVFTVTASAGSFNRWIGVTGLDDVSPNNFTMANPTSFIEAIFFTQLNVTVLGTGSKAVVSVPSAVPPIPNTDINFPGGIISVPGNAGVVNITAAPAGAPDLGYGFYQWAGTNVALVSNPLNSNTFVNVEGGDFGTPKAITLDTRKIVDFTFVTTPSNKPYDGTNAAVAPTPTALYGSGLTFTTGVFTFNDVNAANNIPMTGVMTITDANHMFATTLPGGALTRTYNPTANITPAPLTITANAANKLYGATYVPDGTTEFTPVGLVLAETVGSVTLASPGYVNTANVAGSTYTITPSAATGGTFTASNYNITYNTGLFTVNQRPLAITADNVAAKVYGVVLTPAGTEFSSVGLQNGETIGTVTLASPGYACNASVLGSPHAITPSAATGGTFDAANYAINYFDGGLTVTPAALAINANNVAAKVYGVVYVPDGTTEFTPVGLQCGETVGSVTLNSAGYLCNASVLGSPHAITPSAATGGTFTASNYTITYNDGSLTVTPAALAINANNVAAKVYGVVYVPDGTTEFTPVGLQCGETVGSVTLNSPGYVCNASVLGSPHTITPSAAIGGTFTASNYTITYNDGSLTVTPAALAINANNVAAKVYGVVYVPDGTTEFTPVGLQCGETVGSVTLNSAGYLCNASVLGSPHAITPSAAIGGTFTASNYTITYNDGGLTVTPAALAINANNVAAKVYGVVYVPDGTTEFTPVGLQCGETVGSVTLNSAGYLCNASVLGSPHAITPSAATGGTFTASNYTITYNDGGLTVTPAALAVTANNVPAKMYGVTLVPAGTEFSSVGLQCGETIGTVTLNSTGYACNAPVGSNPHAIIPSAAIGGTFTASNYTITYHNGTLTVTVAPLTVTANNRTKVYGEIVVPAGTEFTPVGLVCGDVITGVTLTSAGFAASATVAGSTYPIVPSAAVGAPFTASNYNITYVNGAQTVTLRPLTVVNAVAQNKVYDGNTVAVVTGAAPAPFVLAPASGMMPGDDIFLQNHISGAFQPDGTVANGKPVTTAITLGGTAAANYSFNPATSLTANITARPIAITVTPGQTKVYGEANPVYAYTYATGPNVGLAPGQSFDGLLARAGGETVGSYAINQGTLTIVNPPFGGSIANYSVTFNADNFAITPKQLTITGAVANNKVYDGNNTATVSGAMLVGAAFSDALTLVNGTVGTFDNENVGNSKVVTTNMTVTGAAIANYTQPVTPVLSANITPKALTATSVAAGKVYDGTTTAALTSALVGLVAGDDVTLTNGLVGTFASANIGTWAVSNTIGVTGSDVPNYTWTAPVVANAAISARPITVNVPMGQSKAYGQPDPVFAYSIGAGTLAPGQTWTGALSRQPGENVGTYNYITSPLIITDAGSNNVTANYNISYAAVPMAAGSFAITPATTPLVITADDYTKFRCAADPTFTVTTTGLYFGDAVTAVLSRTPAGNDPGTYTINIDSYTVQTGNPANYSNISTVPGTLTIIDGPSNLVTNIVGFGGVIVRKQNGSVAAEIDGPVVGSTVTGFSFNEVITLEAVADNGYVFTGWTQDLTGMTNPGTLIMDCGKVVTATFKKVIYQNDIVVNAPNKIYDGNNLVVGGSASYNGILYGQGTLYQQPAPSVTWTSATYPNALVENNKLVTFSGLALVPNTYYQLAPGVVTQTTTSSITHKSLHVNNASVPARPYNGTKVATIVNAILNPADIVGTEVLTIGNHTTGEFAGTLVTGPNSGANVSNNKNVVTAMTVSGPTADNYTLIQPTLTGDVTPRTLTFTAVSITPKVFDGVTPAVATVAGVGASTTWTGLISGDAAKFSVNVSGAAATFNNQWPGTGKPVTVTGGIAMSTNVGHTATYNAGNYEIVYPINTTGTILPPAYAMFTPTYAVNRPFVPVQNVPVNTPLSVEFSVNVVDINGDVLPTTDLGDFIDFQTYDGFVWVDVAGWSATRSNRTITINAGGVLDFATQYRIVFTGVYVAGTSPLQPLVYTLDGETRNNTLANALVIGNEVRFNTMSEFAWTLPVVTPYGPNIGVCNKTIVLTFRNPVEYRNGNQITDNPKHKFTLQANSGSGWNDVPANDWSVSIDVPGNPKVFTFNYSPSQFAYNTEYRVRMNVSLVDGLRGFTDKVFNYPNQAWMDSEFASVHTQGSGWNWTTTAMYPLTVAANPALTGFGTPPFNAVAVGGVGTFSTTTTFNVGVATTAMTMTPVPSEGYKFVNWERTLNGGSTWAFYTVSNTWTLNPATHAPLCTQGLGFRANFVIKNYRVERSPIANTGGGIVSVTGMTNTINTSTTGHNHGTTPVWTATPAPGKKLASWSTNVPGATLPAVPDAYATLVPAPGVATFTFSSPSLVENVTYTFTANFDTWTPRLKASAGFAGTGAQPATMIGLIQFTTNFVSSISNPGQESGLFQNLQYEQVDVKYDTLVTLLAHGAQCEYQFVKWQYWNPSTLTWIDYVSVGNPLGANPITFKMNQNIRFKAVYQMRTNVNVSATALNPALGTVIIFSDAARTNPIHINDLNGGSFAPGTTLYITSFPEPDYYTWRWDIVGGVTNTADVVLHERYEDRSEWTYTVGCLNTHLKAVIGPKEYQIVVRSESGTRGTVETSSPAFTANTSGMPGRGLGFSFTTGVGGNTATTKVYGAGWFQRTIPGVNTSAVTFSATDKADWAFSYWRVTGTTTDAGIVSYARNYTVNNIQTGMDLTAVFVSTLPPAPTYAVSVMANPAAGASALFGAGNYVANSSPGAVSVTATFSVAPGYTFTNWTAQGVSLVTPTLTTQTFAMPANPVTVTANFVPTQYTVQANVRTYLRATPISDFTVVSYGGTVTPATGTFTFGQTATFTANPLPGFRFVNWMEGEIVSGDGRILRGRQLTENPTLNYVVPPVAGNPLRNVYAIFVEIAIPEYPRLTLTTVANPANYGVVTGAGTYAYGIQALVGQTPTQPGWDFVNWSNNVVTTPVAYVNMTSNQTAVANYGLKNYYLNVYAIGAGTVSGTGSFNVESLPMPVAATPSTGDCNYTYAFMGWFTNALGTTPLTDAGGTVITDPQFNFIPYALPGTQTSVNIWAKFGTVSKTYTVTAATALNTPGNLNSSVGTTTITGGTAPYVNGTELVVSTTPAVGYAFQYWTDPTNTLYITQQTFNHNVNCESMQFIAVYEAIQYTVTASAQMGGTVTPATATYTFGQTATVVAAANMGYQFDGWEVVSGTVTFTATNTTASFVMPASNVVLLAKFSKIPYTVTATAETGGTATPATQTKNYGDAVTVTANALPGYTFNGWVDVVGATVTNTMNPLSFTMPNNNVSLKASFVANPYTVSVIAVPANGGTFSAVNPTYTVGQTVSVTATPAAGFEFTGWTAVGVTPVNLASPTVSFTMPAGNVTLTATFAPLGNTLTGSIKYFNQFESMLPVKSDFTVGLYEGASLVGTSTLNASGRYTFTGIQPGLNYTVRVMASGINTPFGGVSAADALVANYMVIQSPILANFPWIDASGATPPVYTPFGIKVADVNSMGGVTALDALTILYRTVNNITSYPNTPDFQVAAGEVASHTAKTYPQAPGNVFSFAAGTYSGSWTGKAGQTILNIYFVATGDINASYVPQSAKAKVNLNYSGQISANVGDVVSIPVSIDQAAQLGAMTLGLSFNNNLLEVLSVEGYDVYTVDNKNGTIRIADMNLDAKNVSANDDIVIITAKVLAPIEADTRYFEIDEAEFANRAAAVIDGITLTTKSITGEALSVLEAGDLISSAYPNPFKDMATINFTLPEAGKVTIVVYNKFGQEVKTLVNENREAGVQYNVELNSYDLTGSGTYFYRILVEGTAKTYTANGTLILVK